MDLSYVLQRLAIGGGIWTAERMQELARMGFTHIVDLQEEFDDTALAHAAGVAVLWHPAADDLEPKPAEFFERAAAYALAALEDPGARVYVHCAAGIHRAPLAAAGILCGLGFAADEAVALIVARRPVADFPPPYLESLRRYAANLPQT